MSWIEAKVPRAHRREEISILCKGSSRAKWSQRVCTEVSRTGVVHCEVVAKLVAGQFEAVSAIRHLIGALPGDRGSEASIIRAVGPSANAAQTSPGTTSCARVRIGSSVLWHDNKNA